MDSREILSLPQKDNEFPGAFLNSRMNSALVCPVSFNSDIQGVLFLNSLYKNHYSSSRITVLEKHSRLDRLRLLYLQEALL